VLSFAAATRLPLNVVGVSVLLVMLAQVGTVLSFAAATRLVCSLRIGLVDSCNSKSCARPNTRPTVIRVQAQGFDLKLRLEPEQLYSALLSH